MMFVVDLDQVAAGGHLEAEVLHPNIDEKALKARLAKLAVPSTPPSNRAARRASCKKKRARP